MSASTCVSALHVEVRRTESGVNGGGMHNVNACAHARTGLPQGIAKNIAPRRYSLTHTHTIACTHARTATEQGTPRRIGWALRSGTDSKGRAH